MHKQNVLHRIIRSRPHLSLAIGLGVVAALTLPDAIPWLRRALLGWNVVVWTYLPAMAWLLLRADHRKVQALAVAQDEHAGTVLVALTLAALLSLTAIVFELGHLAMQSEHQRALHYGLTALTLFGSWFLVGTLFCIHYAHQYYQAQPEVRPLQFPAALSTPDYWDFLYFSFTVAVAAQTSDVTVTSRAMRKLVLAQSMLSFFFNLVILGLSVNIGAALINGA
jgi:uncharacterized membrane protein